MKQSFSRKPKKLPLEFHKGCKDCFANCIYNKPVTTKLKNSQASELKYGCNSSKRKIK